MFYLISVKEIKLMNLDFSRNFPDIFVHVLDYSNLFCPCVKAKTCGRSSDVTIDGSACRTSPRFISPNIRTVAINMLERMLQGQEI